MSKRDEAINLRKMGFSVKQIAKKLEKYWAFVTGIPREQFYKTYSIKSSSSKNIRHTLPFGTLEVSVGNTSLHLTILGWIEGLKRQT